ncbi:glycine zipper family protein [Pseudomonas syringae]|uniref:DUF6861 domain-containing protein n=1 Tax=Pseudomonas syringae TaxID=317 RepID=UPI001BCECB3E|nr:glycine zipper family protein [Pseudomonas syringae]MBS7473695.1 glycine zipper family protein [Pseudomonas syringae]
MDLLANVPKWDDIERTLDNKFNHLNQSFDQGWETAFDGWNGFTRRVSNEATLAFGSMGGNRIESVKLAMARSYPIIQLNLMRKWASIDITEILPVLLQLVKEVAMIMGGSVAVGTLVGGAVGSLALGAGALPGAIVGGGVGAQVGNLILLGMGLSAIAEYFYQGLPACLATIYDGMVTAWNAEEGVKPLGLDPTGASAWLIDERIDAAAQKLARGQEQLVMLLLTAIVTYITRGQIKAGVVGSLDGIAARSAKLQADMTNKQIAGWLARNEQKLLAHPELRVTESTSLKMAEPKSDSISRPSTTSKDMVKNPEPTPEPVYEKPKPPEEMPDEIPATSALARDGLREDLAEQAGIPRNIVDKPESIWGKTIEDIKQSFTMDGATVTDVPPRAGSSLNAQTFKIEGSATGIKQIQYSPSSIGNVKPSKHIGEYYKITYTDNSKIKIIDSVAYKPKFKPDGAIIYDNNTKYLNPQGQRVLFNKTENVWMPE